MNCSSSECAGGRHEHRGATTEVRKWVDVYPERWAQVHAVRPGITDPARLGIATKRTCWLPQDPKPLS